MYTHIIYFCVAFTRVLRTMTKTKAVIRQLYVVELAVGSEQKLYYFCYDSNQDNCHLGPVLGPSCHRMSLTGDITGYITRCM